MLKLFAILLPSLLTAYSAHAADDVGFRQTILQGSKDDRALNIAMWYPTHPGQPSGVVGETPAFQGLPVVRDAAVPDGIHPLVLLSHGYGGSWRNLAWVATALVSQGYVVAAPDHPATTTFDRRPNEAIRLWKRPQDLSRVIDAMLENTSLAGKIDARRIAAIGHSLGGWTVIELAGGQFDPGLIMTNCMPKFGTVACELFTELGMQDAANAARVLGTDVRDARIRAVVTLDLGPARGFTEKSLAAFQVPVLVIASGKDVDPDVARLAKIAATNQDSAYLADELPPASTAYETIPDALHFSFMQICKPGAAERIEEETPGDGIVCKDGGTRDRQAIHQQILDMILAFLKKAMPNELAQGETR